MKRKMFSEVHNNTEFSLNIYRGSAGSICFDHFTSAFQPSQVDESYEHPGQVYHETAVVGPDGKWDTRGHPARIVRIDHNALLTVHGLSEGKSVPVEEARFIQPFTSETLKVFHRLASSPKLGEVLVDSAGEPTWQMSPHWNETAAQKDGTIKRETLFRPAREMVLQGPLFYVSNPLYKTPRKISNTNRAFDTIDLTLVEDGYVPRTNYGPMVGMQEYRRRMTKCRWDSSKSHGDFYRFAVRNMMQPTSERSLIGAIVPPSVLHMNTVESVAFRDQRSLLYVAAMMSTVIFDFFCKSSGMTHLYSSDVVRFPWGEPSEEALVRQLKLNCLTEAYDDLWDTFVKSPLQLRWSVSHPSLIANGNDRLLPEWSRESAFRAEYPRRLALVETDVLVAQAFGLTLDQLLEMYRIYFPVLQENEAGTWYDQNGRIVWTCSKGLPRVGYLDDKGKSPGRKDWEAILEANPSELVCSVIDDTMPDGPHTVERRFVGPFFTCDRAEDYKRAWAHFEKLDQEGVQ